MARTMTQILVDDYNMSREGLAMLSWDEIFDMYYHLLRADGKDIELERNR